MYEEDRLVDHIFSPVQRPVTDETLADTEILPVNACHMPVLSATELMVHKILSYGPHSCDYSRALPVARALREAAEWVGCASVEVGQVSPPQLAPRLATALR